MSDDRPTDPEILRRVRRRWKVNMILYGQPTRPDIDRDPEKEYPAVRVLGRD